MDKKKKNSVTYNVHTQAHRYIAVVYWCGVMPFTVYGIVTKNNDDDDDDDDNGSGNIYLLTQNTVYTHVVYICTSVENSCRHGTGARIVGCGLFSRGAACVDIYI
jgi:hypothetical protein